MKMKKVILALTAAGLVSSQAFAAEAGVQGANGKHQPAVFTEADTSALFDQSDSKPMQVSSLSSVEMKETEGAVAPIIVAGATIGAGGVGGALSYASSVPADQRTMAGWATAIGSGMVGGAVSLATPVIPTAAFWGAGIGAGGAYVANRISAR